MQQTLEHAVFTMASLYGDPSRLPCSSNQKQPLHVPIIVGTPARQKKTKNVFGNICHRITHDDWSCKDIFLATQRGCIQCLEHFIGMGNSLDFYDTRGFTPLHCALMNKEHKSVLLLLHHGADIEYPVHPHHRHYAGYTPVNLAIVYGSYECLTLLLAHGAREPSYRFLQEHYHRTVERIIQDNRREK